MLRARPVQGSRGGISSSARTCRGRRTPNAHVVAEVNLQCFVQKVLKVCGRERGGIPAKQVEIPRSSEPQVPGATQG